MSGAIGILLILAALGMTSCGSNQSCQLTPHPTADAADVVVDAIQPQIETQPQADSTLVVGAGVDSGPCPGFALVGTREEIASTPRANPEAELQAIHLDGTFVASQATYDRIVADMGASPSIDSMPIERYNEANMDGFAFVVYAKNADTLADMESGAYTAWNCLNNYYGPTTFVITPPLIIDPSHMIELHVKGIYNLPLLAGLYQSLPGVAGVNPYLGGPPWDGPSMCTTRNGDAYQYLVRDAYGDCLSGCFGLDYYCFESTTAGNPIPLNPDGGSSCEDLYNACEATMTAP